jgi:anti-sigma B factor antagonist
VSPKRFEPSGPAYRSRAREYGSLSVTGRSRRVGDYAREAYHSTCRIDLSTEDGTALIDVEGQLDLSCGDRFIACLRDARDGESQDLVVDLRQVTFIDSTGLSLLLKADALARQNSFKLHVVRSEAPIVHAVMEATGVDKFLPLVDEPPDVVRG